MEKGKGSWRSSSRKNGQVHAATDRGCRKDVAGSDNPIEVIHECRGRIRHHS